MKRTLVFINVLLLLLIVFCVWLFQKRKTEADGRQAQFLRQIVPTVKQPAIPSVLAAPVSPQVYAADTVQRFLFSRDRNPNVTEKPKVKPPEPPMPRLPTAFGLFMLGDKPTIFLAVGSSGQRGYHAGDAVGDFKLLAFDEKKVTLGWNGKTVERTMEELAQNQTLAAAAPTAAAPAPIPDLASLQAQVVNANTSKDPSVGPDIGGGERACVAGDTAPDGTISADGYKKITTKSPFGPICRWTK